MDNISVEECFTKIIKQNEAAIFKICRLYYNDIEIIKDLSQEIIINLWRGYQNYTPDCKIITWLYRIALNTAISYKRKQRNAPAFINITPSMQESLLNVKDNELIEKLYRIIERLNPIERSIIFLYLEGNSHTDIAEIIGISISNVGTRIQRIKEKMKKINCSLE